MMGFSAEEQWHVQSVVAAVLHLGNLHFTLKTRDAHETKGEAQDSEAAAVSGGGRGEGGDRQWGMGGKRDRRGKRPRWLGWMWERDTLLHVVGLLRCGSDGVVMGD